jgi:hypothetical protein
MRSLRVLLPAGLKQPTQDVATDYARTRKAFGSPTARCRILGGMGITRDTVVERIFRDTRAFRIYDGPSEVHRGGR